MFHIIVSTMGFAGDDEHEVVEAENSDIAEKEKFEELIQNVGTFCAESFDTEEEAEDWMEENGYC